jgi:hypothetical protein
MKPVAQSKILWVIGICLLPLSCAITHAQPVNIALEKTVTFNSKPNYPLCSDSDDNKQLTDGKYSAAVDFQKQKTTVGWRNAFPIIITIDLGSVQPISGVSYSTITDEPGFGLSRPTAIYIAISGDQKTWHYAGDLIDLSPKPPAAVNTPFRYTTHDLQTKGRYISFAVVQPYDVVADEIEVYQGDAAWLDKPAGGTTYSSVNDIIHAKLGTTCATRRLNDDIETIRHELQISSLPATQKSTFNAQLDEAAAAVKKMPPFPTGAKTILPLNDVHRDILAIHGEVLAAEKFAPLTVWKQHRYAWLPFLKAPDTKKKVQLKFSMLHNQFRSDALLLTNASGKSKKISLRLNHFPTGTKDGWIKLYSVAWTDTAEGTPVADALLPVTPENHVYEIDIPAGMTRKVWFTVDSSKVPAGDYKSTFTVEAAAQKITVPILLHVSRIAMKTPRLSLGMWDFTNGHGGGRITPQNRQAAIELMRSHFVDTAWASRSVLPMPDADDFDEQGNLKNPLDFSELDHWIAMWPGARRYYVFKFMQGQSGDFAGAKMGSAEFNARVGSWAKVLSVHIQTLGMKPSQLGIEIIDESQTDAQDAIIAAWAKAIKTAAPELTLFSDPQWWNPDQAKNQEAITSMDVLCPLTTYYRKAGTSFQDYYQKLRTRGKELWFYQCSGPVRLFDPQAYYRYQAWQAFASGATGQGFWSFADSAAPTSWNNYATTRISFEPEFIDKDAVYDSVHWDAVREGMEDNEELSMLADAIKKSSDGAWKTRAQHVLNQAVSAITNKWNSNYDWRKEADPAYIDMQLQQVQHLLETSD